MKRYVVTLEREERDELAAITRKGSHRSQKVINAPILLSCDEGDFNGWKQSGEASAGVLRISARKADGEFEARLVALSCSEPPEGHSQWSLRLLADRAVELDYIDSVSHEMAGRVLKKKGDYIRGLTVPCWVDSFSGGFSGRVRRISARASAPGVAPLKCGSPPPENF